MHVCIEESRQETVAKEVRGLNSVPTIWLPIAIVLIIHTYIHWGLKFHWKCLWQHSSSDRGRTLLRASSGGLDSKVEGLSIMRLSYWDESKRQYLEVVTWVQNPTRDACQTSACHPIRKAGLKIWFMMQMHLHDNSGWVFPSKLVLFSNTIVVQM